MFFIGGMLIGFFVGTLVLALCRSSKAGDQAAREAWLNQRWMRQIEVQDWRRG